MLSNTTHRAANQRADDAAARLAFKDRVELGAVKRDYAYIAGEVRKPSRMKLPFETRASLADILFEDTGFDIKSADYSEIYVLRRATRPEEMGGVTAYHLNAKNAAALTEATVFELRPNDVVFVAEQPVTSWNRALSQLTPQFFLQAVSSAGL
jgi:polysaccharide export outer membrane protein